MENLSAKDELDIQRAASLTDTNGPVDTDTPHASLKVSEVLDGRIQLKGRSGGSSVKWFVTLVAAACLAAFVWIMVPGDGVEGIPGSFHQVDSYHASVDSVADTAEVDVVDFEIITIDE